MATQNNDVTLLIGGKAHSKWQHYDIDSDLLQAADAWQLQLGLHDGEVPAGGVDGAEVVLMVGRDVAMTGRDDAVVLVDCSAPVFTARQATLAEVVASVVKPLGISRVRIASSQAGRA